MVLQRSALPTVYSTSEEEYLALTTASGLHNASYMGRLKATGDDGLDLLNRLSTNKVIDLTAGQGAPTILTTDRGRILDLIGVVNADEYILLITSPGAQQQVIDFLDKYTIMEDLTVEDITEESSMFSVLGPNSQAAIESASGKTLGALPTYHSLTVEIGGHEVRIVHRPFGDLPSYDMLMDSDATTGVWDYLTASGITPVGEEAFEAARLNYSVPEYGREISEAYNPLEAGLIGSIDFAKGCYIGQEVIARLDTYDKVKQRLVGLALTDDSLPSTGTVISSEDRPVGVVTSAVHSPALDCNIALGYVRSACAEAGTMLQLSCDDDSGTPNATVVELPFVTET